jgi:hypothetical protein
MNADPAPSRASGLRASVWTAIPAARRALARRKDRPPPASVEVPPIGSSAESRRSVGND